MTALEIFPRRPPESEGDAVQVAVREVAGEEPGLRVLVAGMSHP